MNNNFIRSVICIGEERYLNTVDESKSMKADTLISNHNEIIDQLKLKIEIQQANIHGLSSEMNEIKINFQVQNKMKDHELLNLRDKCEKLQNRVKELEGKTTDTNVHLDNSSNLDQLKLDQLQNTVDKLIIENRSMKGKIKEFLNENDSLVQKLPGEFKHCPVLSFDHENDNCSISRKFNKSEKDENEVTNCFNKSSDLCLATLTEHHENHAITSDVDDIVQKVSDANKVQQVHINEELTKIFEDNIDNVSSEKSIETCVEIESNPLNESKNDVTCVKENCCEMTAKYTDHSDVEELLNQDQIKPLTTTVNDKIKKLTDNKLEIRFKFNPICALQELCMSRNWPLPDYKFFEEGDSKVFTYSVECNVMTFSVKVVGMYKQVAKRQAASEMYQKIKTSEDYVTENECKDNELIESLRTVTSAGFDEKPSMATAIDSIGHTTSEANQYQLTQFTNKSNNNNKHHINSVSNKKINPIDLELKSLENNNFTCNENNFNKVTDKFTGYNEVIADQVQDKTKTINSIENIKKKLIENKLETRFKFNPICALQELCMSRNWPLPEYKFFEEGDSRIFTYSVECNVMTFSVKVVGMFKKVAKRQAASEMYHKIKNATSSKVPLAKDVSEMKHEDNGITNVFMSAGFHSEPHNTGDKKHVKVNEDSFEMCDEVVSHPACLEEHDTSRLIVTSTFPKHIENRVLQINESVIINEDKQSLFASVNADLARILRLSNKPSVRNLKEMKTISILMGSSNVELLQSIAEEEDFIINYEIFETCTLTMSKNLMGVRLTINDNALTVIGFGETLLESQEDAVRECLTRFKSILKD